MRGKVGFVLGVAVGVVIGSRAGRHGYEQLKLKVTELWESPRVQDTVSPVESAARERFPAAAETIADVAGAVKDSTQHAQPSDANE